MNKKFPFILLITIILVLGLSISCQSLLASWVAPTDNPPADNINNGLITGGVTGSGQAILGNLGVEENFIAGTANDTLVVNASTNRVGIGTDTPSNELEVNGTAKVNMLNVHSTYMDIEGGACGSQGSIIYTTQEGGKFLGCGPSGTYLNLGQQSSNLWQENGSDVYYNSGNVGIGLNSPDVALHIEDNSNQAELLKLTMSSIGKDWLLMEKTGYSPARLWSFNAQNANFNIKDNHNNAIRLTIDDDNGYVGIGDDSPSARLDVNGTIRATELCDENGSNCIDTSSGSATSWDQVTNKPVTKIIYGNINGFTGNCDLGCDGVTVQRTGVGSYKITYDVAFTDYPSFNMFVRSGLANSSSNCVHSNGISKTGATVYVNNCTNGNPVDNHWNFLVVGK